MWEFINAINDVAGSIKDFKNNGSDLLNSYRDMKSRIVGQNRDPALLDDLDNLRLKISTVLDDQLAIERDLATLETMARAIQKADEARKRYRLKRFPTGSTAYEYQGDGQEDLGGPVYACPTCMHDNKIRNLQSLDEIDWRCPECETEVFGTKVAHFEPSNYDFNPLED